MAWTYNNGNWTHTGNDSSSSSSSNRNSSSASSRNSSSGGSSAASKKLNSSPNLVPEYSDNNDSTKTKDNATKEIEINILEGTLTVTTPIPKLKSKSTIFLTGLGRNLTGLYYVSKVVQKITSSGYTQTLTLSKSGFGDSLKKGNVSTGLSDWWDATDPNTGRPKKIFSTVKYTESNDNLIKPFISKNPELKEFNAQAKVIKEFKKNSRRVL